MSIILGPHKLAQQTITNSAET